MRRCYSHLVPQSIIQPKSQPRHCSCQHFTRPIRSSNARLSSSSIHRHAAFIQGRCFSSLPSTNGAPPNSTATTEDKDNPNSLHSTIHRLLTTRHQLNQNQLEQARHFLFITSKWHNEQGAKLSEALLEKLYAEQAHQMYNRREYESIVSIDTEMYNAVMSAWNNSHVEGSLIVERVESIFDRMKMRYKEHGIEYPTLVARPDRTTYNSLLHCYSKSDDDSSAKVHAIFDKMNSGAKSTDEYLSQLTPNTITYNTLLNYHATRSQKYSAQKSQEILLEMSSSPEIAGMIDSTSFNTAIKAWSNVNSLEGAQCAKGLLEKMRMLYDRGFDVKPDAVSFACVIDAFAKAACGANEEVRGVALENAMEVLDMMETSSIEDVDNINSCYNAVAKVYLASGVPEAGKRVRELMLRMRNMDAFPDERMFVKCIEGHVLDAQRGDVEGFNKAFGVLDEMSEVLECNPSVLVFNSLLDGLVKANTQRSMKLAEDVLHKMEEMGGDSRPDVASYNRIIGALSRSNLPGSEQKAVDYLRKMLRSYNTDHYKPAKPTSFAFNCIISMLDRSKVDWAEEVMYKTLMSMETQQRKGNTAVIPDTVTYNTVIGKLSKRATKENAKKIMKLLSQLESNENNGGVVTPDIITYTNVLNIQQKLDFVRAATISSSYLGRCLKKDAFPPIDQLGLRALLLAISKSDKYDHAMIALQTWERLESSHKTRQILDSDICNLVLLGFSKVKTDESAEKVLSFLRERFQRHQNGDKSTIFPTVIGMSAALNLFARSGRVNDAFSLLEIMKEFSKKGDVPLQPDVGCYISILAGLSGMQSSTKNNAIYAKKVLQKASEDIDFVPVSIINAAINACAWTGGTEQDKLKAIQISFEMFELTKLNESYDAITFGLIIKASMKLSSDDGVRLKLVQKLFHLCAKNGFVGNMVLREIEPFKSKLLVDGRVLPEWTKNASDK